MIEQDRFRAPDGEKITVWRWPEKAGRPTLHWAHATGFHGRMYKPVLDLLSGQINVTAWDMRGHGQSRDAGRKETFKGWQEYYGDLAAFLETKNEPVWLAGHSVGGMTSLAAGAGLPEKVAGFLIVEPVILGFWKCLLLGGSKIMGKSDRFSLAAGAKKRVSTFASRQEAFDNFRSKPAFRRWTDQWLKGYVEHGLVSDGNGQVCLACPPEWESLSFSKTEHRPISRLSGLKDHPCIRILAGAHGSTFPVSARNALQKKLPQAVIREIPGSTHFLPMEHSDLVANWILETVFNPDPAAAL